MSLHKKRVIVVLGMHRSGTSAIVRSLHILGVGLGDNLYPAGFDNPKGFWEDAECLEINEQLLFHLGSGYDKLGFEERCVKNESLINILRLKAIKIVAQRLKENGGLWGFKDPRTCRLLFFWRDVFTSVGCEVSYVVALRNPLSVVESLAVRNRMSYVKSFFLWIQHVLSAVLDTVGCSRVVVDYELLMENPLGQIERMSSVLRLPMADKDSSIVHDYVNNFLDKNLQHTKYSAKDILFAPGATLDVLNTYEFLSKASRDEISLDNYELLSHFERFRNQLQAVAPIFLYINRLEDESIVFQQGINDRDAQLAERDAQLAERDAQLAERDAQLAERDGQLESLLASRSWRITAPLRLAAEAVCRITARR